MSPPSLNNTVAHYAFGIPLLQYLHIIKMQGGRGHWTVNYIGTKSFIHNTHVGCIESCLDCTKLQCPNFCTNDLNIKKVRLVFCYAH